MNSGDETITVYLDLNHVIEVCRLRAGRSKQIGARRVAYEIISEATRAGLCTVLFNPAVFLELAESRRPRELCEEVAAFFESCLSVLEVDTNHAYLFELVEEVRRQIPDLPLPRVSVIRPVGDLWGEAQLLLRHHPGYPGGFGCQRDVSIRTWMESALAMAREQPQVLQMRTDGWRHSVQVSREILESCGSEEVTQEAMVNWAMQGCEIDRVLASAAPDLDQSEIWSKLEFDRCLGCRIFIRGFWHFTRHLAGRPATDNDADDWIYVPAVAYADHSLIERSMCAHLVSGSRELDGRVHRRPHDLVVALDW